MPPGRRILIIRHAEKPSPDGTVRGVTAAGDPDPHELSVRGWQRAGALARLFAPLAARPTGDPLATPTAIFASAATPASPSLRPQHTVALLAALLGLTTDLTYAEGDEAGLAAALTRAGGSALVCWHHEHLVRLVRLIAGAGLDCPATWPDDRFDMIWLLDRADPAGAWRFSQMPQMLLAGDAPDPIR